MRNRFHGLKKIVRNDTLEHVSVLTLNTETPPIMEQIQSLQSLAPQITHNEPTNVLPAKMDSQVNKPSLPWRDHPREALAANVQTHLAIRRAHEPRVPSSH